MFKPLIGKGLPEFNIKSKQINNNGEDGVLYLEIFPVLGGSPPTRSYKKCGSVTQVGVAQLRLFPAEVHSSMCCTHIKMNSFSHGSSHK